MRNRARLHLLALTLIGWGLLTIYASPTKEKR